MKKIKTIILLSLTLTSYVFYAQEEIIPLTEISTFDEENNVIYYYKDINNDLSKFLGTWKYEDSNKELIVKFYLKEHNESGGMYYDEVFARFKYTENEIVVYNTMNDTSEANEYRIFGGLIYEDSLNNLSLGYYEPTDIPYDGAVSPSLNLKYLSCDNLGCSPQLKWDIFWTRNKSSEIWPFKIPSNLILTKQ